MGRSHKRIIDLNPTTKLSSRASSRYVEYKNLLMNAVKIRRTDGQNLPFATETLIKNELIEGGLVGYDRLTDKWASVYGSGLNDEGNPINLTFTFKNGKTYSRKASYEIDKGGAYFIKALPILFSLGSLIYDTTTFLSNCDIAIDQNIDAIKTPYIVVSKDKDLQLSIEQAIQQKEDGKPVIVVSEDLGEALKSININVDYIADKIDEIADKRRDKLLNKLGIMTANINKRERVQVGEVNATVGQCSDYIYLLIDTFNNQMTTYGLPFKMSINGSLEELYEDNDNEAEENERKEDSNNA